MIKVKTLQKFQTDLQCGMSIDEACRKHKISFKYACDNIPKIKPKPIRNKGQGTNFAAQYIQERNGKYFLRKQINGKTRMFGTYHCLKDAVRMREYCKEHGWKQKSIDKYCSELGIKRVISSKNKVRYH